MPGIPLSRSAPKATSQALALLREHSLATLAQQELERRITSGDIAAGTKLNEVDIAAALGVSRGPVREAFSALSQAGLVRVEKNRGVFVREVSLAEAEEFYEVRCALEGLIGRLAARRIEAGEIEQLRSVVQRMRQVPLAEAGAPGTPAAPAAGPDLRAQAYFALNLEFHELLASAARNRALLANYRGIVNQLDLYRRATLAAGSENIPLSTAEHEAIVEAVAARDEDRAEQLLSGHVRVSRSRLHEALARQPAA